MTCSRLWWTTVRGGFTTVGGFVLVTTCREGDEGANQKDDLEEVHVSRLRVGVCFDEDSFIVF